MLGFPPLRFSIGLMISKFLCESFVSVQQRRRVFSSPFILPLKGEPASHDFPHDCAFVLWSRSGGPLYLGAPFFPGLSGVKHCTIFLPRDPY